MKHDETASLKRHADTRLCIPPQVDVKSTTRKDLEKLDLEELISISNSGNADAMVVLGLRYAPADDRSHIDGYPPADINKAVSLFQAAADKGSGEAEAMLGIAYINGFGRPKDDVKAAYWFRRAAEHGSIGAQFWIGEMTAKGRGGILSDWKSAIPFFKTAADGGSANAYLELGFAYFSGFGIEQNDQEAAVCYRYGARLGSQIAQYNLRALIDEGRVSWEDGDPGIPPVKPHTSPTVEFTGH